MAAEVSIKGAAIEVVSIRPVGVSVTVNQLAPDRYDVSTDGQHFLVAATVEQKSAAPLTLAQNWTSLLKKK